MHDIFDLTQFKANHLMSMNHATNKQNAPHIAAVACGVFKSQSAARARKKLNVCSPLKWQSPLVSDCFSWPHQLSNQQEYIMGLANRIKKEISFRELLFYRTYMNLNHLGLGKMIVPRAVIMFWKTLLRMINVAWLASSKRLSPLGFLLHIFSNRNLEKGRLINFNSVTVYD